jgi:alanyl-tRNA synthetase
MKSMTSAEIRQAFLDYFEEMGHKPVPSSSLVPGNDPTLLFTNAGMVQFKDVFLGLDKRPYNRATTSQKCLRVSGKHNDLEEVGPSARHHTFFEMLGNFSFGSYFKSEAIRFAYDLITKVYSLPLDRLYFTVHQSDDEAFRIWTEEIGVPADRVYRLGDKTNFWQMADTGPCGPTSEIHWDWEPELGREGVRDQLIDSTGRMLELWNLVFMQYNQSADGTREPLPAPGVDTGMGLERIVSVIQGVRVNYETDLFTPIIARIEALCGHQYADDPVPFRVIADHTRAASFLIADGVTPGAKGRDAVARIVIRRAVRFGKKLGFTGPFLADVADTVIETMGGHYKELVDRREAIRKAITQEEVRFGRTLEHGLEELDVMLGKLPAGGELTGTDAFLLKASLGLPLEVIKDIAKEKGYGVDENGFTEAERQHQLDSGKGKAMGKIESADAAYNELIKDVGSKQIMPFVAYDPYHGMQVKTKIKAIMQDGHSVKNAEVGDRVEVILDATCFYVESGGQVSDTGTIHGDGWTIDVEEMKRPIAGIVVHVGEVVEGSPAVGADAVAAVDAERRADIMRNHTATHLLHAQLRAVLGGHVQQRGSLVAPDRLRFDFSHDAPVTAEQINTIVANINDAILENMPVVTVEKDLQTARSEGAMALFGEKYGERVRTVTIDDQGAKYSYELCGGTHVPETAVIGAFVVTSEGSVSQGVRRIEALTGHGAQQYISRQIGLLRHISQQVGAPAEQVVDRVEAMRAEMDQARLENLRLRRQIAKLEFDSLLSKVETINNVPVLIAQVAPTTPDIMREMTDWFRDRMKQGVVVIGMADDGKPQLIAAVTDDLTKKIHAGNLIKSIAKTIGGGGGGRPNMAQAGGKDSSKLGDALAEARQIIHGALQ